MWWRSWHDTELRPPNPEPQDEEALIQRLCAKLHVFYGVPIQQARRRRRGSTTVRYALRGENVMFSAFARSRVYDLRQHTEHTFWGPFLDDGSQEVDWEKVEAIMLILDHNIQNFVRNHEIHNKSAIPNWTQPFKGANPYSYVSTKVSGSSIPMQPSTPLEAQDPYNVTGTWARIVCFLDYTELYAFNFRNDRPLPPNEPRRPLDTEEATRLIEKRIRVTKVEAPHDEDGKGMPRVTFKGTSYSVRPSNDPNANSVIRGMSDW